jgi:hypothetical protein
MLKIDLEHVKANTIEGFCNWTKDIGPHQVAVYVMCGGGFLGQFAARQPADFYIDSRVGRLPFGRREIGQAVAVLATIAEAKGLDPHHLPPMPDFHACGIF